MPTTTNFGWTTPADTDLLKNGASAIRTLGSGIDTSFVDLKGGTTGQYLKKTSNTDLDFEWGTITSGGMTLITETVANANSSITFSSIPTTYKQLILTWNGIYHSNAGNFYAARLNNNTNNIYKTKYLNVAGTTISNSSDAANNHFYIGSTYLFGAECNQTTATEKMVQGYLIINNANSTTKNKLVVGTVQYTQIDGSTNQYNHFLSTFDSTSAISSIEIVRIAGTGTLTNYGNSTIQLYGVA